MSHDEHDDDKHDEYDKYDKYVKIGCLGFVLLILGGLMFFVAAEFADYYWELAGDKMVEMAYPGIYTIIPHSPLPCWVNVLGDVGIALGIIGLIIFGWALSR
jgi:hypothetical protein